MKFLLDQGTPINSVNASGQTGLQLAAQHGHPAVVSELLRQKADPLLQDESGGTAESAALRHGHKHIVQMLRSSASGDELEIRDSSEQTRVITVLGTGQLSAPHVAMIDLKRSVIDVLIEAGVGDAGTIYVPNAN